MKFLAHYLCVIAFLILGAPSLAQAQSKPIACAFDQLTEAEKAPMGQILFLDATSQSQPSNAVQNVEKAVLAKVEHCPNFKAMSDRQITLAEGYALTEVFYGALRGRLTAAKLDGGLIDALWNKIPPETQDSLIRQLGDPSSQNNDSSLGAVLAQSQDFRAIGSKFMDDNMLDGENMSFIGLGVGAILVRTACERVW